MTRRTDRLARAAVGLLLYAYPRAFRARFASEFVAFALARRADAMHRGPLRRLAFWLGLVADVARTAPGAHLLRVAPAIPPHPTDDVMTTLRHDLRFAVRAVRRRPGFSAVVAITLALGIGATTAIFSVVDGVLLQRLPWPAADRLVAVVGRTPQGSDDGLSYPDYVALREGAGAFEQVAALRGQSITLAGVERPDRLTGVFATASAMRLFGATIAVGRALTDVESELGTRAAVAVLSHEAWETRFGGDASAVGRVVRLNGLPFTIVGVTAAGVQTPVGAPDVWVPLPYYPNAGGLERGDRSMSVFGRLRADASLATARQQVAAIAGQAAAQFPETNAGRSATTRDLKETLVGSTRQPLAVVLTAVAVLLLIACLNVANLQLARAIARQRETAVRAAIGATGSRLARQLLTETLVLATLGGALGVALGAVLLRLLVRTVAADLPAFGGIHMDGRVLAVAALATVGAAIIAGLVPAWRVTRRQFGQGLGTRDTLGARGAIRARSGLVVGQLALSVTLLAAASLLDRSLVELQRVRPGFDARNLLAFQFRLPATKYDTPDAIRKMFARTLAELRATPGVRAAALVRAMPFDQNTETLAAAFDGQPLDDAAHALQVDANVVSDGYFATMGLPVRRGRDFSERDDERTPMVAVVSEELARRAWPDGSPIGKRLRTEAWPDWATVIGVVPDAKQLQLSESPRPQVYVSFRQRPMIFTSVVLRTADDPMRHAEAARRAVWRVDADQAVWRMHDVARSIASSTGAARALATLTTVFALVALTLAAVGIFGVMSFVVAQRRREMGIRIALGAKGGQIAAMVVRHGLRLTAVALALGLAGALSSGRLLASQLYGVAPHDPVALGAVAALLAAVALVACWLPARRASRVDPKMSLQAE